MRAAFSISGHRDSVSAVQVAQAAESAHYADVWLTEDYCERGAFALAGAVAAATSRVQVGLGVVNPWTRHPALLAMEFATLDELSDGRGILGLGASNAHWMTDQLGIEFEKPLSRTLEAVRLTKELLKGSPVQFSGEFYQVNTQLAFTPVRMNPPLILGVKGERAIQQAGQVADGLLLSILAGPAYVAWVREQVGPGVEIAAYVTTSVDRSAAVARDRIRPLVAHFLGVHGDHVITRHAGVDSERAALFREGWRAGSPRVDLVTDELLTSLVAAGTIRDVSAALTEFETAGLDTVVIRDDPSRDPTDAVAVLDDLALR